ncbi:oligoendopeptidase F [Gracilibacillus caseinilyticus]|uniref:Oligopeptidase F n=1 Tax=Gracilibacillus caseinilyticus TaxID=2932256 RepID=A0ABY4ETI0_9BACI|nr:oligoendopeptidase F [Gracilibacillus caseinilyticus]UOQ46934.1 oligoendopeptidase F [Gracilibacillus caseinilyticus]
MAKPQKSLPKRDEIPEELTWKLEDIYANDDEWDKEWQAVKDLLPKFQDYQGTLDEKASNVFELLQLQDEVSDRLSTLYTYAHMRYDQDTTNSFYQAMNGKAENLITQASSTMSFITPEILKLDETTLKAYLNEHEGLQLYRHTLDEINRQRPHVLSEKEEALLAEVSEVTDSPSQTFGMLNNADLTFPGVKDEQGNEVDLTHGRYINFLESKDQQVRHDAFKAMYDTYGGLKNTFASTLQGNVKKDNFYAKIRNYKSAREAALNQNNIPEKVYDNLIEAIHEGLPLLQRYVALRKKVLNLQELHMYDLYTPLVKDVEMTFSYEQAQQTVTEALKPLGDDYLEVMQQAFSNRWIDVEENKGKRSGAYSSGSYSTNPYILMNWQDNLNNLFTLAHELGHSMHSYYTHKHQPYRYGNYSIFVAEVASTCNEALLNNYLVEKTNDKKEKLFLLNHFLEGFRGTVFRQTMFAEFEHQIHVAAQEGEALTADKLTEMYYELNKLYFGDDLIIDEEIGLEWARIPHFYYNYYVYQYATGYAAAQSLASQILEEKDPAVERYLGYLQSGSSDYPIEVLKKAGVDMTEKTPVLNALKVFEQKLEEMEQLLNEIE